MGRKQTVNIAFLGSLIRQWDNNRDITHAMQIRLIKLLLGTDVNLLMDAHGKYPASNFNMIALALRCHSPKQLVNAVIESGVFVVERCNEADLNCYGIRFFASPLFYVDTAVEAKEETPKPSPKTSPKSGRNISIINNTDSNSVLSERINEEVVDEFVEDTLTNKRYLFDDIMKRLQAPSNDFSQQFDQ